MNNHVNKNKKQKQYIQPVQFKSEHKPYTKEYKVDLVKHMLTYLTDFTYIKKITGLSITKMLQLNLIEYYYPFKKYAPNPDSTKLSDSLILVDNTAIKWLRAVR